MLYRVFRFYQKLCISKVKLKMQIRRILMNSRKVYINCPICNHNECMQLDFNFENKIITKYLCVKCKHIFSNWLGNSLIKAQELFNYEQERPHNNKIIL